jgi:acetolactate synthase-1/2/3 large subunit
MPTLTGGEAVVKMLELHGVEIGFGMGGFQALPYYDALARQQHIRHVVIRDEKHGAFAADGYARVKNRPAIVDGTLGPGATNLISGAAESFGASIPMLLMTSEVNSHIALRGATQESRQFEMMKPTCKESFDIHLVERIPEMMRRAFASATSGRPGPVNMNISEDAFHGTFAFPESEFYCDPRVLEVCGRRIRPDPRDIETAAHRIRHSRAPIVIAGGGVHLSQAYAALESFIDVVGAPVATTISGKGAISELHPMSAGLCGRYSRFANELIAESDLVLIIGCKLGEIATNRWTLLQPGTQLIHIDIDPSELGKVYRADVGIWADARLALEELALATRTKDRNSNRRIAQVARVRSARAKWLKHATSHYRSEPRPVHMADLLRELRHALPPEAILVADGGFAAHWSALLYDVHVAGRTYIANRGHAAIGYGLPGAIGAKLASPRVPVVALCGDNGFAMAVAELETAKRSGANLIAIVVNNGALGYVKALQHAMYDARYISVDFLDTDYSQVAHAFGCDGMRVTDTSTLPAALAWAIEAQTTTPVVIDVLTTTDPAQMLPGVDARSVKAPRIDVTNDSH